LVVLSDNILVNKNLAKIFFVWPTVTKVDIFMKNLKFDFLLNENPLETIKLSLEKHLGNKFGKFAQWA
jgi:hypothetical protein